MQAAGHSIGPALRKDTLKVLMDRVVGRFTRKEPRRPVREFVLGLLSAPPLKNCWTLVEHATVPPPDGPQHLPARAKRDADTVRERSAHPVLLVETVRQDRSWTRR
jgi:hypothetical protein